jgi:DNA polymerase-3 subunit delta'
MQFKDVIGQREVKQQLLREVQHDKISHAQLFLGNLGHGALPLVLSFAQYILCQNRTETDSCGICDSCRKASALQHPDLHFSFPVVQTLGKTSDVFLAKWRDLIQKTPYFSINTWNETIDDKGRNSIIGAEESLQIIKKLSLKSFEGGNKIMIIWKAEEMNPTSANKLLKILEEPPEKTIFLLIAENQESLLQTILSRTQIIRVPRIGLDEMRSFLQQKHNLDISESMSVASQVEGNYIDALELLQEGDNKEFNREMFIQLMRVCYKKDVLPMISWAESIAEIGREKQKIFLRYAIHMFRQSMLRNYTENQLTKTSQEEDKFLANFARFITGNNITGFMENFNDAYYHIERNANPKILFTELCFKVMRFIHFA